MTKYASRIICIIATALLVYWYKPAYVVPVAKDKVTLVRDREVFIPVAPVYFSEVRGVPVYLPSDTVYRNAGYECSSFAVDTILRGDTLSVIADCYQKALRNFELRMKPVQATVRDSFIYEKETVTYTPYFAVNATVGKTLTSWDFGINASLSFYNLAFVPEISYDLSDGLNAKASLQFTIVQH